MQEIPADPRAMQEILADPRAGDARHRKNFWQKMPCMKVLVAEALPACRSCLDIQNAAFCTHDSS